MVPIISLQRSSQNICAKFALSLGNQLNLALNLYETNSKGS